MATDFLDALEFLAYFTGFWSFLFNGTYRRSKVREWKDSGWIGIITVPLEILIGTFCGTLPVWGAFVALHYC